MGRTPSGTAQARCRDFFVNGKKWRMRRVGEREREGGEGKRRYGVFLVTRAMSGLIYIKCRLIWLRCHSRFISVR